MKVSVSLPDADVAFLDQYARTKGFGSRSAVMHRAVRLLRASELECAYQDAWDSWAESGEAEAWDQVAADGVDG